jgi:hypothetical protein
MHWNGPRLLSGSNQVETRPVDRSLRLTFHTLQESLIALKVN